MNPARTLPPVGVQLCQHCHAPIVWATSAKTGKRTALNAELVEAGTDGALMVAHGVAYSKPKRDEASADFRAVLGDTAIGDLPHHFPHIQGFTCVRSDQ